MKKFINLTAVAMLLLSGACSSEDEPLRINETNYALSRSENETSVIDPDSAIVSFASILSQAVYENKDVRNFLKREAGRRFDMNSDILFGAVADNEIGNSTFRRILADYSSMETIATIERSVPLLNILIPELSMFDITVENMDCNDPEIPVVVSSEEGMDLYLNGNMEVTIPKGELPDFHTIVVNKNNRVEVEPASRAAGFNYHFISPNYDPANFPVSRATFEIAPEEVGARAIEAHNQFWSHDANTKTSRCLQRDYIYYNMYAGSTKGRLVNEATEYLGYMYVDPHAYFKISDDHAIGLENDDPYIKNYTATKRGSDFTTQELINKMWAKGSYDFKFEIYRSCSTSPITVSTGARPEELWDFHLTKTFEHKTWFRDRKYTYKIDPANFTPKKVSLADKNITCGKWDLSIEGMERFVEITEVDKKINHEELQETTRSETVTRMRSNKIDGSIKFGLGTLLTGEFGVGTSGSTTTSTTKSEKYTYKVSWTDGDDFLGRIPIYFYDPLIMGTSNGNFIMKEYSTGYVTFAIFVK